MVGSAQSLPLLFPVYLIAFIFPIVKIVWKATNVFPPPPPFFFFSCPHYEDSKMPTERNARCAFRGWRPPDSDHAVSAACERTPSGPRLTSIKRRAYCPRQPRRVTSNIYPRFDSSNTNTNTRRCGTRYKWLRESEGCRDSRRRRKLWQQEVFVAVRHAGKIFRCKATNYEPQIPDSPLCDKNSGKM